MALAKKYRKNIVCLESLWNHNVENRLSVLPILELVAGRNDIRFTHLTCNTPQEFIHNIEIMPRRNGYSILYLAFHGKPGRIVLENHSIHLEALAEVLGRRFTNWIIHFGCCGTLAIDERRIRNFISNTQVLMVSGYKKRVDWLSSTVIDLLLLDQIQSYRGLRRFWNSFDGALYPFEGLGLTAFHK
jgi:hypothetical protein